MGHVVFITINTSNVISLSPFPLPPSPPLISPSSPPPSIPHAHPTHLLLLLLFDY